MCWWWWIPEITSTCWLSWNAQAGRRGEFRFDLARKAFAHTAAYDSAIAGTLSEFSASDQGFARAAVPTVTPSRLGLNLRKIKDLRYGENPHQAAAWYAQITHSASGSAVVLQGKELSFTNLLDLDSAARIALEFDEPAAAVIKHTNPCGAAIGATIAEAYVSARDADSLAAFGGIVGVNAVIDEAAARALVSTFIEAVIAPGVTDQARRDPGDQAEHACGGGGSEGRRRSGRAPGSAVDSRRDAGAGTRRSGGSADSVGRGVDEGRRPHCRDEAGAHRMPNGWRCGSRGASARM